MEEISRRKLLREGGQAAVASSVALYGSSPLAARERKSRVEGVNYYEKLGVAPLINAAGTYTVLSASIMPDEVQAAIALASKQPVNLNELLDKSGEYLAKRLRCEAALLPRVRRLRWWLARRLASPKEMIPRFSISLLKWAPLRTRWSSRRHTGTDTTTPCAIAAFVLWRSKPWSNTNKHSTTGP